jgi:UDP-2,3-diacylglucosamine pyrophosphatase LpxH
MKAYKAIFVSDVHLGTKMSQANRLLEFLKKVETEKIYLIGDIIDGWALKSSNYWPKPHSDVIDRLLKFSHKNTKIIYVPGNHDEFLRSYCDLEIGNFILKKEYVHYGIDGRSYLIIHGDEFDNIVNNAKLLAYIGAWAYDLSISLNILINKIRSKFGLPYWSLSSYIKQSVKESVKFISNYEKTLSDYVKSKKLDGVICGHIHHANISTINGVKYMNCGDWVESLTCLVENYDGSFEILDLTKKVSK